MLSRPEIICHCRLGRRNFFLPCRIRTRVLCARSRAIIQSQDRPSRCWLTECRSLGAMSFWISFARERQKPWRRPPPRPRSGPFRNFILARLPSVTTESYSYKMFIINLSARSHYARNFVFVSQSSIVAFINSAVTPHHRKHLRHSKPDSGTEKLARPR